MDSLSHPGVLCLAPEEVPLSSVFGTLIYMALNRCHSSLLNRATGGKILRQPQTVTLLNEKDQIEPLNHLVGFFNTKQHTK